MFFQKFKFLFSRDPNDYLLFVKKEDETKKNLSFSKSDFQL